MDEERGLTPYETREILFYKTDNGDVRVEILLYQENLWLTQAKMAELFEVQKAAISKHLKNIFESGELMEESVVSKMETTAADGKRYNTNYYNLDAIIAVGYRVNSKFKRNRNNVSGLCRAAGKAGKYYVYAGLGWSFGRFSPVQ